VFDWFDWELTMPAWSWTVYWPTSWYIKTTYDTNMTNSWNVNNTFNTKVLSNYVTY
jgi:hypothetical protein